jgi:hypothetical protein
MKIIILLFSMLLLLQNLQAQNKFSNKESQKIYDFQDKRLTDSLLKFPKNELANLAFDSSQDVKGLNFLLENLQDSLPEICNADEKNFLFV